MSRKIIRGLVLAGLGLSAIWLPASAGNFIRDKSDAAADEQRDRYYAVFLSHQSPENLIELSHVFATFCRTTGDGPAQRVVGTAVISWFPKSEVISLSRPAEAGVNNTLADSLAWAEQRGLEITVDGVYEIRPELFQRAVKMSERLIRGELRYQAFDRYSRKKAKNCIHAVADIVEEPLMGSAGTRGRDATRLVIRHLRPYFVSADLTKDMTPLLAEFELEPYAQPAAELASTR